MGRVATVALLLLCSCTQAFAPNEGDLMREPPPLLPTDSNAFWNDRQNGTYGQFTVGPGLYLYQGAQCRTARVTSINGRTGEQADQQLLYCAGSDGRFSLRRELACRPTPGSARISCRDPEGRYETLDPA